MSRENAERVMPSRIYSSQLSKWKVREPPVESRMGVSGGNVVFFLEPIPMALPSTFKAVTSFMRGT